MCKVSENIVDTEKIRSGFKPFKLIFEDIHSTEDIIFIFIFITLLNILEYKLFDHGKPLAATGLRESLSPTPRYAQMPKASDYQSIAYHTGWDPPVMFVGLETP